MGALARCGQIWLGSGLEYDDPRFGIDSPALFNQFYGSPLSYDYEADDSGSGLPSGWSWVNQGTSTLARAGGRLVLTPPAADAGAESHRMIVRAIPSEASWNAFAKLSLAAIDTAWQRAALILRESSSGKYVLFGPGWSPAVSPGAIHLNKWTTTNTFSAVIKEGNYFLDVAKYLRIRKNSSTSWDFMLSPDGVSWSTWSAAQNISTFLTADQIGFLVGAPAGGAGSLDWLRVR